MGVGLASLLLVGVLQQARPPVQAAITPRPFVQGGVSVTRLFAGTPNHRVRPAFEGTAVGVQAAFAWPIGRRAAIDVELAFGGSISQPQGWYYNWYEEYITVNRDVFFTVGGRFRPLDALPLELVASGGLALSAMRQHSGISIRTMPPRPSEVLPNESASFIGLTLSGGADAPLRASERVAIVPGVRMRWVSRSTNADNLSAYAGVGPLSLQFSLNLRLTR